MLTMQDDNQSKKGLGEIYAVSILALVHLVQETLFWLLCLLVVWYYWKYGSITNSIGTCIFRLSSHCRDVHY